MTSDRNKMGSQTPFSINISGPEPNETTQQSIEFKEYIITNNIRLQKDNSKILEENQDLTQQLNEKETELDKEEERLRYLKGVLNNLNEVRKLALESNKLQSEKCQKSTILMKRVVETQNSVYRNLILISRIMTCFLIISILYRVYHWKDILSCIFTINFMWIPLFSINFYHSIIVKKERFNMFNGGYYKLSNDLKAFEEFSNELDQKIKKALNELKEIEDSNLSLEHWIADI